MKKWLRSILCLLMGIVLLLASQSAGAARADSQQVLFTDDFEKGLVSPWDWEDGWDVEAVDGNHALHAAGHIWIRLTPAEEMGSIESFESRVLLRKGSIHINFRTGVSGGRYFVRMDPASIQFLKGGRMQTQPDVLVRKEMPIDMNRWYTVRIEMRENHFQVFLDDQQVIDITDQGEIFPDGSIAFESLDESDILVDDVVLKGQPVSAVSTGPSWVFTGGPRGGIGYDIRFSPTDQNTIWVTDAYAGAHESLDGGVNWIDKNKGIDARSGMSGDAIPVFSLAIDPKNPDVVWAGVTGARGLFKTTDRGKTWMRKDNGIIDKPNMEVRGITIDPQNSNVVYCGGNYLTDEKTMDQRGFIYKSTDSGETWSLLIEPDALVRWIIVDYTDSNILYASTGIFDRFAVKPTGILKSLDGGKTWAQINNGLTTLAVGALAMHPSDHLTLIAGTGKSPAFADDPNEVYGGVFMTHDGGQTWTQVDPVKAGGDRKFTFSAVAFAPSDPNIIFADSGANFFKSADGGATWEQYYVGPSLGGGMLESRGQPIALAVLPTNPNKLYMNAYDGGVFISDDGGKTWNDSSKGYAGSQVWGIAIDPHNPGFVVSASKNGIHVSYDGGGKWNGRISGPGINNIDSVAVDPTNHANILIGKAITADVFKSIDGGFSWKEVLGPLGEDSFGKRKSIQQIAYSTSNPQVVYAAAAIDTISPVGATRDMQSPGVYKSEDGGSTWNPANAGLEGTTMNVLSVAVNPQNPDVAYLGEMNSGVYKTTDGGKSWQPTNKGLLKTEVRALAVDPKNPDTVYAGAEYGGMWKSEDGGVSWKNISSGISPESSVRAIVIDPSNPANLYAADAQTGVFRSTDGGNSWQSFRQGIKVKAIHDLAISADGQTLYAATEGNGVYRMDLGGRAPAPLPEISLEEALGIADNPIKIDGDLTDWAGRKMISPDPIGDAQADSLDFKDGYAFTDDRSLYFALDTPDAKGAHADFDIIVKAGDRRYICSIFSNANKCGIGDITGQFFYVNESQYSQFSMGKIFEGRLDYRDFNSTGPIKIEAVNIMNGTCCGQDWKQTESWEIKEPIPSEEESLVAPLSAAAPEPENVEALAVPQAPGAQAAPQEPAVAAAVPVGLIVAGGIGLLALVAGGIVLGRKSSEKMR
jgi:photosystem II stability/assembly factor-like uncharacterized protein